MHPCGQVCHAEKVIPADFRSRFDVLVLDADPSGGRDYDGKSPRHAGNGGMILMQHRCIDSEASGRGIDHRQLFSQAWLVWREY